MPPPPPPCTEMSRDSDIDSVEMEDAMSVDRDAEISSTTSPVKTPTAPSLQPTSSLQPDHPVSPVKTKAALKEMPEEVVEKVSPLASMSDTAVATANPQDVRTSDVTAKAPRVRKSRFGPPLAANERSGIFDTIRQVPSSTPSVTPSVSGVVLVDDDDSLTRSMQVPATATGKSVLIARKRNKLTSCATSMLAASGDSTAEEDVAEKMEEDSHEKDEEAKAEDEDGSGKRRRSTRLRKQRKSEDAGRVVKGSRVQARRPRKKKDESQPAAEEDIVEASAQEVVEPPTAISIKQV